MSDNIDIIVQDTINDIIVNSSTIVETIDIVVEASVEEVTIISNPNDYIININRIIGEQVQSDWDETQPNDPSYIKNKPTIPDAQVNSDWNATTGVAQILNKPTIPTQVTNTSELTNDGADGVHPFITAQDLPPSQVNSDWNATSGVAQILNKPTIPAEQVNSDWNATSGKAQILNKPTIPSISGLATVTYVDSQDALKVDKIAGKGLSTNDFTNTLKTKLDGIQDGAEVNVNADWNATSGDARILNKPTIPSISGLATITYVDTQDALKVDKVTGKGLSTNDYTTTEKNKLAGIQAGAEVNVNADWNATSGDAQILNKPTIPSISGLATTTYVDAQDALKVDKVTGYGLSQNDFTNTLKTKLDGIQDGAEVNVNADWNATSGDAQILNKPTIPAAQVNSDWNATSGVAQILNKPTIPDTSTFVPYTGATADVDLNGNDLYLEKLWLNDPVNSNNGSVHFTDGNFHIEDGDGHPLLVVEDEFLQIHKNATIQSNLWTSGLSAIRDHYLPNQSGTIALTSDITGINSGTNTGDETTATIKSKLGITTLSGSNTGDQDLSGLVVKNSPITGATKTKITYDSKGLVTAGADATTADIADSTNKRYVTDANLTTIGNQSGTNTGDETTATIKSKLGITTLSGSNTGDQDLSGLVPNTRTINTKALSSDVTLTTADIADSTNKRYVTDANLTTIGNQSGTNTGDNATNTQYSGLATSKQDTLVSGTNIKTINGNSVLGSGNLVVSGGSGILGVHSIIKLASGSVANCCISSTTLATIATNNNRMTIQPFIPAQNITSSSLYINVTVLGVGANSRILIYSDLNGYPNTKLYESTTLDCSTTGQKTVTTTFNFVAGTTYWIGTHFQNTCTVSSYSSTAILPISQGIPTNITTNIIQTATFGSPPSPFGAGTYNVGAPMFVGIVVA